MERGKEGEGGTDTHVQREAHKHMERERHTNTWRERGSQTHGERERLTNTWKERGTQTHGERERLTNTWREGYRVHTTIIIDLDTLFHKMIPQIHVLLCKHRTPYN